jgi:hypothetical protein
VWASDAWHAPLYWCIELRLVPSLWPLHDLAVSDRWDFSIVRMRNARPREDPSR